MEFNAGVRAVPGLAYMVYHNGYPSGRRSQENVTFAANFVAESAARAMRGHGPGGLHMRSGQAASRAISSRCLIRPRTASHIGVGWSTSRPISWTTVSSVEKELLDFFVSGHPLDNYRHVYESKYITRIADVQEVKEERVSLRVAGVIQRLEVKYTKKDNRAFATFGLEDFSGTVEVISWSEGYEKFKDLLVDGGVIGMKGRCEKDSRSETIRMTVQEVKPLKPVKPEKLNGKPKPLALYMDVLKHGPKDLDAIHKILTDHPGETPVQLRIMTASGEEAVLRVGRSLNVEVNDQLQKALQPWVR